MSCLKTNNILLVLLTALSCSAQAADLRWQRDVSDQLLSGDGTGFSMTHLSLLLPFAVADWHNRRESLSSQLRLERTAFNWAGTSALRQEYYWIGVPLSYRQQRGRSSEFLLRAEPGLMTDSNSIGVDAISVDFEASGRFYVGQNQYWQLGLTVDRDFGNRDVYPVLAVGWRPDAVTEVVLGFPRSHVRANWSRDFSTYAEVRPAGGVWTEELVPASADAGDGTTDSTAAAASTERVTYQSWQFGSGAAFHWRDNWWLSGEIGYLWERRIQAKDSSGSALQGTPADTAYWQLGLQKRY